MEEKDTCRTSDNYICQSVPVYILQRLSVFRMALNGMTKKDCQAAVTLADSSRETNGPHVFPGKHVSWKWIVCDTRDHDAPRTCNETGDKNTKKREKGTVTLPTQTAFSLSLSLSLSLCLPIRGWTLTAMNYNQRTIFFSLCLNPAGNTVVFYAVHLPPCKARQISISELVSRHERSPENDDK